MPGGTSGHQYLSRFDESIEAIESLGQALSAGGLATAVVVSHGAAIRAWVAIRCEGADVADTARRNLVNTGMLVVAGSTRAGWRLERRIDPIDDSSPVPA